MRNKKILITGACGFIGFHLSKHFIKNGFKVVGLDNLRKTYNHIYKQKRLKILNNEKNFRFIKIDLKNLNALKEKKFDLIIHLAGEAGVRDSIKRPNFFIQENLENTVTVFEFAKDNNIKDIFYASSSSVYGKCNTYPSRETLTINKPLSVYGLSKSSCELLAYYYKEIFNINSIGLRFFTVYGPLGRPDMSMNIFINNIIQNKKITLFNYGKNFRDYTYVEDIVNYIFLCYQTIKNKKSYYELFNIGGESTVRIDKLLAIIESLLKRKAKVTLVKKNKLDPVKSLASNLKIKKFTKKKFKTSLRSGVIKCINSRMKYGI